MLKNIRKLVKYLLFIMTYELRLHDSLFWSNIFLIFVNEEKSMIFRFFKRGEGVEGTKNLGLKEMSYL